MLLLLTCTVITVDDGLLRTSTGCATTLSSSTLYVDWLKLIIVDSENNSRIIIYVKCSYIITACTKQIINGYMGNTPE